MREDRNRAVPSAVQIFSPSRGATILVVDDETSVRDLVASVLDSGGRRLVTASDAEQAWRLLGRERVDLVVTDLRMPGTGGRWLVEKVQARRPWTASLVLTAVDETRQAIDCLRGGALDYIVKPFDLSVLRAAVDRALERVCLERQNEAYHKGLEALIQERTRELRFALEEREIAYGMALEALVTALDARERDTHNHSYRVAVMTATMARAHGVSEEQVLHVFRGALLHDIGKIGIPDAILLKPGRLTEEEWEVMREHPEIGWRILDGVDFLEEAREIVRSHHERWDGAGYPRGLRASEIPLGARLFAIADCVDAMTSNRPYRRAAPFETVPAELDRYSGAQFDPGAVALFHRLVAEGWRPVDEVPPVPVKGPLLDSLG